MGISFQITCISSGKSAKRVYFVRILKRFPYLNCARSISDFLMMFIMGGMRKLFFVTLLAVMPALSACGEEGSEEYATPTLFLSHVRDASKNITVESSDTDFTFPDYGLVVKNDILQVGEFIAAKSFSPSTERHMRYRILFSHSTAGPNYACLFIYADGTTKIDYKKALGFTVSFYFTCDSNRASSLCDSVRDQLVQWGQDEEEAIQKGEKGATVEKFCTFMEVRSKAEIFLWIEGDIVNTDRHVELLALIKRTAFTKLDDLKYERDVFRYQDPSLPGPLPSWSFGLGEALDRARVIYTYEYKGVVYSHRNEFALDTKEGESLLSEARLLCGK